MSTRKLWVMVALFGTFQSAQAHDERGYSDWIGGSGLKGPTGLLCCGWNDCPRVEERDVHDEADGVHVLSPAKGGGTIEEIVPWKEVQPSVDGHTYRCAWPTPDKRKCFFRKMPGS